MVVEEDIEITPHRVDGPVHCILCNTTFSSHSCLLEHFPCPSSSFDMAKVKTEIEDSEQEVGTLRNSANVEVVSNMFNHAAIKAEVKPEPTELANQVTDSDNILTNVAYKQVELINQGYGSAPRGRGRGRGRRGRMCVSRGRGGQNGRRQGTLQPKLKAQSIAPKAVNLQMQLGNVQLVSGFYSGASQQGRYALPNILPKVTIDNNIHEGTGLKIDSVFYTQSCKKKMNVVKVANVTQANSIFSVDSRTAICSPGTASSKTTVAVPNTFTLHSGTDLPSLTGQNINTLQFTPFILGSNILQNAQHDPLILRGSGPLVNPGQSVSRLQPPSLIPALQTINLSQPLTNLQNLSIPLNQNTAHGVQQNIPQVFNAGTQSNAVYTSNTNQAVGSIMASAVSPSQQMSYMVPVHMGNQIVLMDVPVQYLTGAPFANVPTTISLSSLIQSTSNPFSSTITPVTVTQHSTASAISPSQPCNNVSVSSIYPQSVLTTTKSTIVSQKSSSQSLTTKKSGVQDSVVPRKSPPALSLVVSSASSLQKQTGSKLCSTNLNEVYSDAATNSSTFKFKLPTAHNRQNQTAGTPTEKPSKFPSNVTVNSLHNKELYSGSSESATVSDSLVDKNVSETLKLKFVVSNGKPITAKAEIAQSVITSSDHQSVMSTGASSGTLVTAGCIPLLNASDISVKNIVPHPPVSSMIQQPFLSPFQTNDNIQHGSMPVFNNNTVNIGSTSGLFLQNGLNMQRLNFPVQKNSGQNVWIQNITKSQPVDIGCGNNQQQIFLNSPVHKTVVSSQIISPVSSTPSHTNKSKMCQKLSFSKYKTRSNWRLWKNNILSIKMETPDTMEKNVCPSEKKGKNLHTENHALDSPENVVSPSYVESQREPKTVKEMLKTKVGIKLGMTNNTNSSDATSSDHCSVVNQSTQKLRRYKNIRPYNKSLETQLSPLEIVKGPGNKSALVRLLTHQFDNKTGLLRKDQLHSHCDNFNNASLDDSGMSQSNEDAICKIMEVRSMADLTPKPVPDHSVFLNANKLNDGNGTKGTLLVGPLTKEQLDKIIQNPSEIEKYVRVPNGHILSTKALVVPAVSNSVIPKVPRSKVTSRETSAYSYAPLQTSLIKPESAFIRIHPKTIVQTVQSPSHSVTANTSSSTVTSFPQTSVSTNYATSNVPNTTVNNLITSVTSTGETETVIDIVMGKLDKKQSNKSTSHTPSSCLWSKRKRKCVSEQRRQELKCNKNEASSNSNIMKLSFVGDLKLLKDALRKTTVSLERLDTDCETCVIAARHHNFQIKNIKLGLETIVPNSEDHYKLKLGKRKLPKVAKIRDKETKIVQPTQKQWIPTEVVGDLAIRGKILECEMVNEKTYRNEGKRRSNRINAKPRLDYADLERLPFIDLDAEIEEQDCNFESFSSAQLPQLTTSPSPPVLSPAVERIHEEDMISRQTSPHSSSQSLNSDSLDVNAVDSAIPVLTSQGITSSNCVSPANNLNDYYYSSESESDMFDPCAHSLSKADKKKMMWKQHNEITMFLVKHVGRFHSDDEKNEHYCNICQKYKTNGIFRLSHHLKKHLNGSLKCSQCAFEACHKKNLAEHRKTLHLL